VYSVSVLSSLEMIDEKSQEDSHNPT